MQEVPQLLKRFFDNSNRLCSLLDSRRPEATRHAASAWRECAFQAVDDHLVAALSAAWSHIPKGANRSQGKRAWASVLATVHHELNTIVAQQDSVLDRASRADHGSASRGPGRSWRTMRTVMRNGANLLESLRNLLASLPVWANALLEALRELFAFYAQSPD